MIGSGTQYISWIALYDLLRIVLRFTLFGNQYFEFANYQVAECITAEGRRIHKQMESLAENEPYNFKVVFGFTDSTFFNAELKQKCKSLSKAVKINLVSPLS